MGRRSASYQSTTDRRRLNESATCSRPSKSLWKFSPTYARLPMMNGKMTMESRRHLLMDNLKRLGVAKIFPWKKFQII